MSSEKPRPESLQRCWWCGNDPLYVAYHDEEWGEPVHNDRKIFEMLILEGFQAGLSWITVLRKRENFRRAFASFDPNVIASWGPREVARLQKDAGIVRNRLKIEAAIKNARGFLQVQEEFGTFDKYIWGFVGHRVMYSPKPVTRNSIRATSPESDALSKDLKKRGFSFVGSTIMYAHMQATGMVNDHALGCFKYQRATR